MPRPHHVPFLTLRSALIIGALVGAGTWLAILPMREPPHPPALGQLVVAFFLTLALWTGVGVYLFARWHLGVFRSWLSPGIVVGTWPVGQALSLTGIEDAAHALCARCAHPLWPTGRFCTVAAAQQALRGAVVLVCASEAPPWYVLWALKLVTPGLIVVGWTPWLDRVLEVEFARRIIRACRPGEDPEELMRHLFAAKKPAESTRPAVLATVELHGLTTRPLGSHDN